MKKKAVICFVFIMLFMTAIFPKTTSSGEFEYSAYVLNAATSAHTLSHAMHVVKDSSSEQSYSVTFTRSGLRSGIMWTLEFEAQFFTSYADSITIYNVSDGVYTFSIPEVGGWPTGYTATPSSGSVTVKGENVTVEVIFTQSTLKLPSTVDLSLFILAVIFASVLIVLIVRRWRKSIRYLRWASKAAFLFLFIVPIAYLVGVPWRGVYSLFLGSQIGKSWLLIPITQSVCIIWTTNFMGDINPGAWIACPLGHVTALITGMVDELRVIPTIIAMLVFIIPLFLLGNVFCSWACPIGTIIDSFDKFIEKFAPKIEAKRNERYIRSKQSKKNKLGGHLLCPACPISRLISNRSGILAYGILGSTVVGTIILRINIFCSFCPMGIISRGVIHLKSLSMWLPTAQVTGQFLAIVPELFILPVATVLVSIRERRFWCRKLCPLGAVLNGVGALNPFIKPKIEKEKCVMKGCPSECKDFHSDYCIICRYEDNRKCEKVCPVDINLVDKGSLHKCTKCMECYIACEYNAVQIDLVGKPDIFRIRGFFKRPNRTNKKNETGETETRHLAHNC